MLFWREGGISVERYTNPDCKPEMEELMKDCPRSRSGAECWLRLCDIEDILGDEYDLDELKEVVQAKREGRCVVLDDITVADLRQMLSVLDSTRYGDSAETYTTGYRNGHRNGRIEILRHVLGIYEGTRAEAQAALRREQE